MSPLTFTIYGAPRAKGNNPRVFGSGQRKVYLPSKAQAAWFKRALTQVDKIKDSCCSCVYPIAHKIHIKAVFYRERASGDLDNLFKSLGDFLQRAGFIVNDSQIESWDGSRKAKDKVRPRIEVEIREFLE